MVKWQNHVSGLHPWITGSTPTDFRREAKARPDLVRPQTVRASRQSDTYELAHHEVAMQTNGKYGKPGIGYDPIWAHFYVFLEDLSGVVLAYLSSRNFFDMTG